MLKQGCESTDFSFDRFIGCGRFENSAPVTNAKPELKSAKTIDDSGNYIMPEQGDAESQATLPPRTFRQ
tara:strand:- start:205 stop:411 length:207 start_codon:yes stop_codon:yes gene_type:complete